jgi:hypothetical protein
MMADIFSSPPFPPVCSTVALVQSFTLVDIEPVAMTLAVEPARILTLAATPRID